jgi:flotillin
LRQAVETLRLQADVVLPADARRQAAIFEAQGKASYTEEEGKAQAAVLQMMTDAWLSAGEDAKEIFLIQQLESVLQTVVERVNAIEIDEVVLLDGGTGDALPRHVASFPAIVRQVLEELHSSTGVNVTGILAGSVDTDEVS